MSRRDEPRDLPTDPPEAKRIVEPAEPATPAPTDDLVRGAPLPEGSITPTIHYYRAEIGRGDIWRQRMDATTNWAIGTTAAIVSVAFSRPDIPHVLIPIGGAIVFLLLCIEGRRYRFYDVWRRRTRLLEAHFFVPFLLHDRPLLKGGWREHLAEDLLLPAYKMSFWRATGSRLRRNYIWIFLVLLACWISRVAARVSPGKGDVLVFVDERATLVSMYDGFGYGPIPGWFTLTVASLFYVGLGVWIWWSGRSPDPDAMVYTRLPRTRNPWQV